MSFLGKPSGADIIYSSLGAIDDLFRGVRILLDEWRHRTVVETQRVVADEHLAVAVWSGADADRRNAQAFGNLFCDVVRYRFENDGENTSLFEHRGVFHQLPDGM